MEKTISISLPYVPEIGKNKMKGFAHGRFYTKPEYKDAVQSVADIVRAESKNKGIRWSEKKTWIGIYFQKPRLKSDVANLIDGLCDGIKVGIGVDDCYFSIVADFDYNKDKPPFVDLTISQDENILEEAREV